MRKIGHFGSNGTFADTDSFRSSENIHRFYKHQANRQGIAVLGFNVNDVNVVHERYKEKHPNLIHSFRSYEETQVLEVFAYYQHDDDWNDGQRKADGGTLLRFIESKDSKGRETTCKLPGLDRVDATFDESSQAAYCDHWVSNVFSRTEFLSTLEDTLGFTPKVDFNAGVVAAGEAQIESTVTGNDSLFRSADKAAVLQDQSQVYLPINNALSEVGYVMNHDLVLSIIQGSAHTFHLKSRTWVLGRDRARNPARCVPSWQLGRIYPEVQRHARSDRRGRLSFRLPFGGSVCPGLTFLVQGFTFLNIPRSYYGVVDVVHLVKCTGMSSSLAEATITVLENSGIVAPDGAVSLDATKGSVTEILDNEFGEDDMYQEKKDEIIDAVLESRYKNLYSLLGENVSEDTYLGIVRNKILCDVQGDDMCVYLDEKTL